MPKKEITDDMIKARLLKMTFRSNTFTICFLYKSEIDGRTVYACGRIGDKHEPYCSCYKYKLCPYDMVAHFEKQYNYEAIEKSDVFKRASKIIEEYKKDLENKYHIKLDLENKYHIKLIKLEDNLEE